MVQELNLLKHITLNLKNNKLGIENLRLIGYYFS